MSSYSFRLPGPPTGTDPDVTGASTATTRTALGGLFDQEIDPRTLDFIDTDTGEWSETADSRSIVLCMLELEFGMSYTAPTDGTRIKELLDAGDPVTAATVLSDVLRAMNVLVVAGVVADVTARGLDEHGRQLVDESGRAVFELSYTDLATGSPVDTVYSPI